MEPLQVTTAIVESGAGAALICCPSLSVWLLLGSTLDTPAAIALGRVCGVALLALGIGSWFARHYARSPAARGLVVAMVLYNVAVVVILAFAAIDSKLVGIALWPAVALHAAMSVWCVTYLLKRPSRAVEEPDK
jgi:hypothetical protein